MTKNSIFKQADGEEKSRETCKQTFKNVFKIISKRKNHPANQTSGWYELTSQSPKGQ